MTEKPLTAAGYSAGDTDRVKMLCLHLAVALGDLTGELIVVGGLVPSLLIPQDHLPPGALAHAGTRDLDLGLSLALLDHERYRALGERLRRAGFSPDTNTEGNLTRQRWRHSEHRGLTVDFLISPSSAEDRGGTIRNLESDLAALIAPGLHLAFVDQERMSMTGVTLLKEPANREIRVCGPGAFVVLKALAFRARAEAKDAYDLYYMIRNYPGGVQAIAGKLRSMRTDSEAVKAIGILQEDFLDPARTGPSRVARFLLERADDALQAEVSGFVARMLDAM